ncbi:MAG: response regulator [bacterium]
MNTGKKILVVEDEKPIAHALELKLTHEGYEVVVAGNGEEAMKLTEEQKFDLIILDLIMPKMTGFEMLEELKKKRNTTPVVVTSNLGQEEDLLRAKDLGAKSYFIKSDTPLADLVHNIKQYL